MIIKIENKDINLSNIKQLYPAAIVKTGYEDETTQVSLEWLEIEAKGKVEVVGFQIFVELKDSEKFSFFYDTKEQLFDSISKISKQIDN
jgi:hypothetical protein